MKDSVNCAQMKTGGSEKDASGYIIWLLSRSALPCEICHSAKTSKTSGSDVLPQISKDS